MKAKSAASRPVAFPLPDIAFVEPDLEASLKYPAAV
jgi:hypothetical protein